MAAGYSATTEGALALSAATAKTILAVIGASNALLRLTEMGVSFDGVAATAVPVLVELCKLDTTSAGTSSSATVKQTRGPTRTVQATAKKNYTAEPTVLVSHREWLIHPQAGMVLQFPLGREPEIVLSGYAFAIRVTAPATVNVRGYLEFEEG